jgi:hypothetical protein
MALGEFSSAAPRSIHERTNAHSAFELAHAFAPRSGAHVI